MSDADEPFRRLQTARRRAGFASASAAARHHNWNENTYRSHENGERGLKLAQAEKYAAAYRVATGWLLTGEGGTYNPVLLSPRFRGTVGPEGRVEFEENSSDRIVSLPFIPESEATIFVVSSNAMTPRYDDGDMLLFWEGRSSFHRIARKEGLIWLSEADAIFGHVSEVGGIYIIEVIGAAPRHVERLHGFEALRAVIRAGGLVMVPPRPPKPSVG